MKTKEYRTIDRAKLEWPSGPWDNEPDKVQWTDAQTGLPCLAVRNPRPGNWCGYVGVAEGHPYFGKGYRDLPVDVHGELTFASECRTGETEAEGICHTPEAGESDHVWWLGFDCAHAYDHSPYDVKRSVEGYPWTIDPESSYRTLQYVRNECSKLAAQIEAAKGEE